MATLCIYSSLQKLASAWQRCIILSHLSRRKALNTSSMTLPWNISLPKLYNGCVAPIKKPQKRPNRSSDCVFCGAAGLLLVVEAFGPPKPASPSKSNGDEAAAAAFTLWFVGEVTLIAVVADGAWRLLFENKSMSSSSGFFAAATEAMAADDGAKLAGTVFVPIDVSAMEGSSVSKSSKFSDFCPATTVSSAFCVEVSASSKLLRSVLVLVFYNSRTSSTHSALRFDISSTPYRPFPIKVAAGL